MSAQEGTRESQAGLGIMAFCAVRCGDRDAAAGAEQRLGALARGGTFISSFNASLAAVARGDAAGAARIVMHGVRERDPWCVFVLHHPLFEGVRDSAPFRAVVDAVRAPAVPEPRDG